MIKMNCELQNEIIGLLPSEELRKAIIERKTIFTDCELLKIVYDFAPDYETRLDLLARLRDDFSGETKKYTELLIRRETICLEEFKRSAEGVVLELHIKDHPDSYDERYVCGSYEAALKLIPLFYSEYECEPTDETIFRIEKRKIFTGEKDEPFSEDYLGDAVLLPSLKLYSVAVQNCRKENCINNEVCDCGECTSVCLYNIEVEFPKIIEAGDVVKYRYGIEGQHERYGVVPYEEDPDTINEYYVIPLDCSDMRYHNFNTDFWDHEHIPAPLLRKVSLDELDEKMREDYIAFMDYLKNKS